MMDVLQSAADKIEKDGNTEPDAIKVKMKTRPPVSSITKLTNVISSCVTVGKKKEVSSIYNSTNAIKKRRYSHIINAHKTQVENTKTDNEKDNDKNNNNDDDNNDDDDADDDGDRDIRLKPKLYIDESRMETEAKQTEKHPNSADVCNMETKLTETTELPTEASKDITGGMVKKSSISVPELAKKEDNVKGCKDRFVRKSQDSSVQPNMSPDSTTYIGDDFSLQKIQRKVSFIYVKNSFICLKCLKKFCGASLFRKHLWWHLHGNTLKDYLCPYCNSLSEKSKCPTVSKIVRLLISSASDSSISLETNSVFGLEKMSHISGNGPHKNTASQQLNNSDYYCWEKLKSKQIISSSVLEHGVGNVAGLYDNGKTNKPMETTDQAFTLSDDAPLNLSINSAHKINLFSDSKSISVYGNTEASLPKNYSQNSYHTFLNVEQNQLIFSGTHGIYFCQDCNSNYESTKSFYAHVLWHLECQLALCSPCMDQCDYLDSPTEKRPGRTCCLMAYIVLCLSEDNAVKKQLKVCWKIDEKHNATFTVYVTMEGNTAEPVDVCKIIPNDGHSGYSVRKINIKDTVSPRLVSAQEHLPVFNSSDLSSLITHSDKTIPYTGRKSKGVITIILCQNIYECLNCKEEMYSHDLLISHLLWHFHSHDHLCTYPNCLTKRSCPVLNNVLPCIPVLDSSFNVQIPFFISWEVLPSGKTHFSVHFMNRCNKDKTDAQLNLSGRLSPASKDGGVCMDFEKGSRNLIRLKTTSPEVVSLTCLKKTRNTEENSSGEKHNDKPALSDVRGFSSNAALDKEKHQSPSCTPLSQKKSAPDNLTEVDNVPSQSNSETDPNDKKSSFEGFEKMSFICKSDQYICLDCSKHFIVLTHFKSHIMWHFHVLKKLCSHGDEQTFDCPILRNIMLCLPDSDKMTKTVEIHWKKESSGKTTFKVQTYYLKPAKPKVNLESHIDFTAENSDSDTVIVIDDIDDNEMLLRQSASSVSFDSSTSADTASSQQETTPPLTAATNNTTSSTAVTAYKENGYGSSTSISTTTLTEDSVCSPVTEEGNSSKTFPTVLEENSVCSSATNLTQVSTCTAAATSAKDTTTHTPSTPHIESGFYAADGVHNSPPYTLAINTTSIPAPSTTSITESIRTSPNTTEQDSVQTPTATPTEDPYNLVSTNGVSDSVHLTSTNGIESRGAITDDQSLGCEAKSVIEHSSVGGFYVCGSKDCKFSSLTPEPFSKHFTQVHSDAAIYPCAHCSIQTETSEKLLQHMDLHATNKMFLLYQCSILSCKFGTNLRTEFSNHLQFCHQSKSTYSCRYCKVGHPNVNSLIKHFESNLLKFIHCPHCNARDTSRIRILNHIRLKHSEKPRQIIVSSQIICAEKKLNAAVPLAKDTDKRTAHKANEKLARPESNSDSSKATKTAESTDNSIHEEIFDTSHSFSNKDKTDESNEMGKESAKELTAAKPSCMDDTVRLNQKSIQGEERLLGKSTARKAKQRKNANSNKRKTGKDKTKATGKPPVRKLKIVLKRVDNSVISKSENKDKSTSASPKVTSPPYKERNVFQLFNEIENSCQVNSSSAISSADCQEAAALNIDENAPSLDNEKLTEEEASIEPSSPNIKETWFNEISLGGPMLNSRLKICFTTEQGKYKCLLCSTIFSTVYKIHLHLLSDHFRWPLWNCMDCGVRFYSLSKIRSHCWRKHKFKDHNIKPLPLPLITMGDNGKPLVNMTRPLSDSERRKSTEDESGEMTAGNKKAPGSDGKEVSPVKSKKKKKSVKVPSKKTCKLCSFSYKKKMELIIHMVLSHNQELKKSIKEKDVTLIEESIIRDESGKFICPFCEHSCKQRVDCKIHIWRVHVGLKYLNCQHCNFVTWFSSCLQKHEQEEHKAEEHANSEDVGLAMQKSHGIDSTRPNYACDTSLSRNGPQPVSPSVNGCLEKNAPEQTHLPTVVMTLSAGDATTAGCKRKGKEPEEVTKKLSKKSSVQHKRKVWKKNKSPQKKSVPRLPRIGTKKKNNTKDANNLAESRADVSRILLSLFQQTPSESTLTNDQTS
ncbi:uncharacterized protein LOC106882551 [Octopus bimaculoides]|uniref:C2H2-type domain-containing protein n=1 Tax=Octopus bimaculoides TaxID=37653 RepID=A0A0L8FLG7_OCTBM|nr:uncharacterized protein LOC106882551 [Octopus bimaculoides]|eukprot:XP_014788754.1 PREDICTED: uncharacterized protein LOC106882551 [Octopus bimaculoides]